MVVLQTRQFRDDDPVQMTILLSRGSDRGALLRPGRLCSVAFPVALFDAAGALVTSDDDADMVRASALASGGDFLRCLAHCQGEDLITEGRRAFAGGWSCGRSAAAPAFARWGVRPGRPG
jgi:hypothetical protein